MFCNEPHYYFVIRSIYRPGNVCNSYFASYFNKTVMSSEPQCHCPGPIGFLLNISLLTNSVPVNSKYPLTTSNVRPKYYRGPQKAKRSSTYKEKTYYCYWTERGKLGWMLTYTFIALQDFILLVHAFEWVQACTGKCPRSVWLVRALKSWKADVKQFDMCTHNRTRVFRTSRKSQSGECEASHLLQPPFGA